MRHSNGSPPSLSLPRRASSPLPLLYSRTRLASLPRPSALSPGPRHAASPDLPRPAWRSSSLAKMGVWFRGPRGRAGLLPLRERERVSRERQDRDGRRSRMGQVRRRQRAMQPASPPPGSAFSLPFLVLAAGAALPGGLLLRCSSRRRATARYGARPLPARRPPRASPPDGQSHARPGGYRRGRGGRRGGPERGSLKARSRHSGGTLAPRPPEVTDPRVRRQ